MPTGRRVGWRGQVGFSLIWLLFLIAAMGVGLAAVGTLWHTVAKREKESELLFIGDQYRRAIQSFWEAPLPPGTPRRFPKDFSELLADPRFPHTVRHLRRLFRDPMSDSGEWGLVKNEDGGFSGVYSLSRETPLKQAGFEVKDAAFEGKQQYSDWVFVYKPQQPATPATEEAPQGQATRAPRSGR